MTNKFLKKLITKRQKQIDFLRRFNIYNHITIRYENEIVLAQIQLIKNTTL